MTSRRLAALALPFLLALAACGDDDGTKAPASDTTSEPDASVGTDTGTTDAGGELDNPGDDTAPPLDATSPDADDDTDAPDVAEDTESPDIRPTPTSVGECFPHFFAEGFVSPDYDQFGPTIGSHCLGTNHQDIRDVEKVVFFGDSVSAGTYPTPSQFFYRNIITRTLKERWGSDLVVRNFSEFGARVDDLVKPSKEQFKKAFPDVEPLRTLIIFTIGGNDLFSWAEDNQEGKTPEQIDVEVDKAIADFRDAMAWLTDPERFPNGVYVVFANAYEFTDATGDVTACVLGREFGLTEPWPEGRRPLSRFAEAYMQVAVDARFDMIFMLESFCGHGFKRDDPTGQCYLGPDAELWFDPTCIHPNRPGHEQIARMFLSVIDE